MTRKRLARGVAAVLAVLLAGGVVLVIRQTFFAPMTITALFPSATAVYPGDDVRVSGVKVGTIDSVQAQGTQAKLTIEVDRDVPVPADAKAIIVAQNLVAARYVQLTPAYESTGPTMRDGAVIPLERTAVPVEWDEVKRQLTRLATDLGPRSGVSTTSMGRFINSTADALAGNGDKLRQTLSQLSGVGRILSDGSGNIVDIIKNLQIFVTALRDSNEQIVSFQNRFATLSSVLDGSRSDLDAALTELSSAVGDVQRFIAGSRNQTSEQIQRLGNVTQNLVDHRADLEQVLHVAANAFANGYNIYNPDTGDLAGTFVLNNLSRPTDLICGAIGAVENVTATESGKLCAQYLGPLLRIFNFNYLPLPLNPYLAKSIDPNNVLYTDPALAPGGSGAPPGPPELPPAVSAYTGLLGDPYPAPGQESAPFPPGPTAPSHLPAFPSPALFPGAPIPVPSPILGPAPSAVPSASTLPELLLPAETAPPPGNPNAGAPQPSEGTPPS
ncbi:MULTISPECIES: MCE family protein [unclassified Mycobacterium]|uniref:MCE family protein n=1 Tax=unclassified Mycobacterium TaxID=2642494 RepID=UPI0029C87B8D|nr:MULTISPECIES: MCE family protein [unclassified Mycobacterium]